MGGGGNFETKSLSPCFRCNFCIVTKMCLYRGIYFETVPLPKSWNRFIRIVQKWSKLQKSSSIQIQDNVVLTRYISIPVRNRVHSDSGGLIGNLQVVWCHHLIHLELPISRNTTPPVRVNKIPHRNRNISSKYNIILDLYTRTFLQFCSPPLFFFQGKLRVPTPLHERKT